MFWLLAGELELHLVMYALAFFRMGHYDDLFFHLRSGKVTFKALYAGFIDS